MGTASVMLNLDTSAVFSLCNRAEIAYLLEARLGPAVLAAFLQDLERGVYTLDYGEDDSPRSRELVSRYQRLPLGFADAAVVACAERRGGRVLTLDERDFRVVEAEGKITLA